MIISARRGSGIGVRYCLSSHFYTNTVCVCVCERRVYVCVPKSVFSAEHRGWKGSWAKIFFGSPSFSCLSLFSFIPQLHFFYPAPHHHHHHHCSSSSHHRKPPPWKCCCSNKIDQNKICQIFSFHFKCKIRLWMKFGASDAQDGGCSHHYVYHWGYISGMQLPQWAVNGYKHIHYDLLAYWHFCLLYHSLDLSIKKMSMLEQASLCRYSYL